MKKAGMIGGLAWPSTVEYYRLICQRVSEYHERQGGSPPWAVPEMTIESVNIAKTRALRGTQGDEASWADFDRVFREILLGLREAGAGFGFIASNTPHMRLHAITRDLDFKVVSIIDSMAELVTANNAWEVLVLGTAVTMRSPVYAQVLSGKGVEANKRLPENVIDEIQYLIDTDFYSGNAIASRDRLLEICRQHIRGSDTVISLACTELPLAFPDHREEAVFEFDGLTFINTTVAHVHSIVREILTP